jgi:two-component system OmpR family sensor kinase
MARRAVLVPLFMHAYLRDDAREGACDERSRACAALASSALGGTPITKLFRQERPVSSDRLTRNELTWLLTQEARSAAQKLRLGVGMPIAGEALLPPPPDEGSGGVETTLNRLDEAVSALASLHGQPLPRGRRGKVDLAALLWEVAPEARVQIEMGEGTTVFGDESELRRMLLVLLGQSGDPTGASARSEVMVRREGDDVKVGVNLGPDKPPTFETERAWLARMATRYGGRLVLEG